MENGHDLPANSAEYVPLKRAAETLASQRFAGAAVSGRPRKWSIGTGGVVQEMCSRPGENVEDAGVLKNGEKGREVSRVEKVWEKLERTLKQIDRKKTSDTAPVSSDILSGIGALEGDSAKRCTVSEEVKALADKLNVRRPRRQSWDEQGSNAENKDSRDRHSMESMHATGKQWQLIASDSLAISATDALHRDRVAESPFRAASDELARTSALIHEAPRLESGIASESSNRPTPGNLEPIRHQAFDEVSEERQSGSDSGGRERLVLQRVDGRLRWTPEGGSPQNEGIAEPRSRQREPEQNGGPSLNQATITEREPRSAPSEIGSQSTAPSSEHATGASNTAGRSNGGATSVSYEVRLLAYYAGCSCQGR